ncbi:hypothetical protein D3870_20665 [Noviherbaspirillum cavernae]|uniref:Uncharacterized protein n=1 Tax=Noviherbaspirillum cavernae TaxID=2320862 RepID=A0A418WVT5_9BURK|nr:hypothetical protein [Noviherbaspirillum cavernae]RJF96800.1 hypothetical protein D3870_20665 [Noviherbaspirillum cavernae]
MQDLLPEAHAPDVVRNLPRGGCRQGDGCQVPGVEQPACLRRQRQHHHENLASLQELRQLIGPVHALHAVQLPLRPTPHRPMRLGVATLKTFKPSRARASRAVHHRA